MRTKRLTYWFLLFALGIILAMVMASCAVPTAKPDIGTSDGNTATSPACRSAGTLVEAPDPHEATLEKCKKIMERGCLLTYTLEDAIDIEYDIIRKL